MYEITIKKTEQVKRVIGKEWKQLGSEEQERDHQFLQKPDDPKTFIGEKMGYTPEVETVVDETVVVLTQNVDTLDVAAVIKAINGL